MTKVTIIGKKLSKDTDLKRILFEYEWSSKDKIESARTTPFEWKNIELIAEQYSGDLDLMFAYDNDRSNGIVFLGYFNDGIV